MASTFVWASRSIPAGYHQVGKRIMIELLTMISIGEIGTGRSILASRAREAQRETGEFKSSSIK